MRAQSRTQMKDYELARLGPKPAQRPDNNEAVRMCVNAWGQLHGDRKTGFGPPGPIPFTALVVWAEVNRLDRETLELLWSVIHQLDCDRASRIESQRKTKGERR